MAHRPGQRRCFVFPQAWAHSGNVDLKRGDAEGGG